MKDVRIPGVAWAILIIVVIAVVHENEAWIGASWGIDPYIIDIFVAALVALLKTFSLGEGQLEKALEVIDKLLAREVVREKQMASGEGMRSAALPPASLPPIDPSEIPEPPNKLMRWWLG